MADTHGSGPCEETRAGSTPVIRTKQKFVAQGSYEFLFCCCKSNIKFLEARFLYPKVFKYTIRHFYWNF